MCCKKNSDFTTYSTFTAGMYVRTYACMYLCMYVCMYGITDWWENE